MQSNQSDQTDANKDNNKNKIDMDELELLIEGAQQQEGGKNLLLDHYAAKSSTPPSLPFIPYEDYAMPVRVDDEQNDYKSIVEATATTRAATTVATAAAAFDEDGKRQLPYGGIILQRSIKLIEYLQKPYRDVQLARHEAAARRNWAVQTAIGVREFFMFAEKSELIVEISDAQTHGLTENQKQEVIDLLKKKLKGTDYDINNLIKKAYERDNRLKLETKLRTAYWQCLIFGDAYILKLFDDDQSLRIDQLYPINTRRVNELIPDPKNNMSIEGAWIDGQALDKNSMIQFHYQPHQISAHTEGYGYTPLESVLNLAEGLNIFYEEDVKEIQRSAWLSSILLTINTAGLTKAQARTRIKSVVDSIDPGKIIGVGGQGENGLKAESLSLNSDLGGLAEIGEHQETKIFKAFRVPQFLVQSEEIATRATADKAAELFLSGVIMSDQMWLQYLLDDQWYDPFVREELKIPEDMPLPFKITRKFKIPTVSEFIDLADGLQKLLQVGVWDVEQANEKLGTPEVADRMITSEGGFDDAGAGGLGMMMQQPNPAAALPGQQQDLQQHMPSQPQQATLQFGDTGADDLNSFKDPKEQLKALLNMKYTPKQKQPKISGKGLSSAVKKKKLEMLQNIIERIKKEQKTATN